MQQEEFETVREFKQRFPSKLYVCSRCGNLTTDPFICTSCSNQSNGFLYTDTYIYTIKETGETAQIFRPIELEKGQQNE